MMINSPFTLSVGPLSHFVTALPKGEPRTTAYNKVRKTEIYACLALWERWHDVVVTERANTIYTY